MMNVTEWACREKMVLNDSKSFLPCHFRRFMTNGGREKGKRESQKASLPYGIRKRGMNIESTLT